MERFPEFRPASQHIAPRGTAANQPRDAENMVIPPSVESGHGEHGLADYWAILGRQKTRILLAGILGALAALLASIPQTPIYQARSSLEVESPSADPLQVRRAGGATVRNRSATEFYIATRVEILESRSLVQRVVDKLKLDRKPEFHYRTGRLSAWRKALGLPPAPSVSPRARALTIAADNYKIVPARNSGIIQIVSEWPDPNFAADFANALAEEFIQLNIEARWQAAERAEQWLGRQLEKLRIQLERSEEKLRRYALESGLMFTSRNQNVADERLSQLQAELSRAQAERIVKQSRFELAGSRNPAELGELLELRDYQLQRSELRRRLAELGATYTPAHYEVKRVQAQLDELEKTIRKQRTRRLDQIRNEFETAQRRERLLAADYRKQAKLVSEQAERSIQYHILNREVDSYRELYDHLLRQVKEAGVLSAMGASNIRVVDPAIPPRTPARPDHALNALLGLTLGLLGGIALAFIRERRDRTLRQPGDARTHLRLPELGVIPVSRGDSAPSRGRRVVRLRRQPAGNRVHLRVSRRKTGTHQTGNGEKRIELVSWQQRPSPLAECFRVAATSILFAASAQGRLRTLVITSSLPAEGKTTVASNLAITLAEIHNRVLLVDADLRRPRLHQIFGVPNYWGFTDLLRQPPAPQECDVDALSLRTDVPGLYLLPSGPGAESITNLLHSPGAAQLLQRILEKFDTVIFDSPPMMEFSEARVLAQMSDAVVLVLRAGATTREDARAAKERLLEDGTTVLGAILNRWDARTEKDQTAVSSYYRSYYPSVKAY